MERLSRFSKPNTDYLTKKFFNYSNNPDRALNHCQGAGHIFMTTKIIDSVPLLDLNAQYETIQEEVKAAINDVLESQQFILGPQVKQLEEQVANYCQADHAVGCASGSDALLLSLMAIDAGPDDLVLTTPYTFFATAGAIARTGATPVFLDIDPQTYNIDPAQLEAFLQGEHLLCKRFNTDQQQVKAVIPVHLYGQTADMDPIMDLAEQHNFYVIEDAAQAIGAEYKGRRAGSIGDFGCFSFFPSKNLGGYGDGGMITVRDEALAEKLRVLRVHGSKPKYHHKLIGINSRLDTLQAAVLQVKLNYLDRWSERRREKALYYNKLFDEAGLSIQPDGSAPYCSSSVQSQLKERIVLPREKEGHPEQNGRHIYHQYVIRTARRDALQQALNEAQIGNSVYYPVPLHEQECFTELGYQPDDCPVAHCASRQTLALPIYPELTAAQQQYVVDTIERFLKS